MDLTKDLKKGDRLRCIDSGTFNDISSGKIYVFMNYSHDYSEPAVNIINNDGRKDTYFLRRFELDEENRKIIGYRLLKDSSGANKGTELKYNSFNNKWEGLGRFNHMVVSTNEMILQTDWFEPIYEEVKPKSVTLKLGSNGIYVEVFKNRIVVREENLSLGEIKSLLLTLTIPKNLTRGLSSNNSSLIVVLNKTVKCIRIGCESENNLFSIADIELVINTSNSL